MVVTVTDWPIVAPLATLFSGVLALLLNRILGSDEQRHVQWAIVTFVLGASVLQIAVLGVGTWGVSDSGLFRLEGLTNHLALGFLVFCFLQIVLIRGRHRQSSSEAFLFKLIFSFLGLVLILSNSLLAHLLAFPFLFLIFAAAPALDSPTRQRGVLLTGVQGALLVLLLQALSVSLMAQGAGTLLFSEMVPAIEARTAPSFYLGWALQIAMILACALFAPTSLLRATYSKLASWPTVCFFRTGMTGLAMILTLKWLLLTGVKWNEAGILVPTMEVSIPVLAGVLVIGLLLSSGILILVARDVMSFLQAALSVPFVMILIGLISGTREGLVICGAGLFLGVFLAAALQHSLGEMVLKPNATLSDCADALRRSSVRTQIIFFSALLFSGPTLSYYGMGVQSFLLTQAKDSNEVSVLAIGILCASFLVSAALLLRLFEFLYGNARRKDRWGFAKRGPYIEGYVVIVSVLFLGVYPTPLYKYLVHSINLFANKL